MKIYAVADIHNNRRKLNALEQVVMTEKPDILVMAGDLANYLNAAEIKKTIELFTESLPVMYVRGNCDWTLKMEQPINQNMLNNLDRSDCYYRDQHFLGIGGAKVLPFKNKVAWFEKRLLASMGEKCTRETILVTHIPPKGYCDRIGGKFHGGSTRLAGFIQKYEPLLHLCGHVHEDHGVILAGGSTIVNCSIGKDGLGYLIEVFDSKIKSIDWLKSSSYT